MEQDKWMEIRNRLYELPGLQDRLDRLRRKIHEAEADIKEQLNRFQEETQDVEALKKDSFSVLLLKLVRQYDGKLDKESQEALAAKMQYDKAVERLRALNAEYNELGFRVMELRKDKESYEGELAAREEEIRKRVDSGKHARYLQLEEEREALTLQKTEIGEAITAANRVRATAEVASTSLGRAEDWATFDAWTRGGIISHLAKYEHIDNAEECFNRLSYQLQDLQKELKDVEGTEPPGVSFVSSTTRAVDFWFDNIFTDLGVRDQIRGNLYQLDKLDDQIGRIAGKLEQDRAELDKRLAVLEQEKKDLLLAAEG